MILAFLMLFAGGMLLGGAWSFYRSKKPWWAIAGLAVLGLVLSLLLVVGIVVANAVTAPYVVFTPGGAYDVLAEDA